VPLQRVTLLGCQPYSCDVEYAETQDEPLTTAPRPSLRQAAGLAIGRSAYKPHLAVISAPPSLLPAGTLIRQQSRMGRGIKRSGDVLFSLAVLGLGSPVLLVLALLVKLSSPGPVFYVQRRVGRGYQRFGCIKFRTMRSDADAVLAKVLENDPALRAEYERDFKLKRDPRITTIGRFLRRSSLDELPQFLNVLRGEMSVVGPRPIVDKELQRYGAYMDEVASVRPGLTGLWQVSGRNNLSYKKRVKLDLAYARGRSFNLDLSIILRTFGVLLLPMDRGAY
jgi:lipopolysaccharide/colanic/teichoic acid biosynthesis glycosyltransferase